MPLLQRNEGPDLFYETHDFTDPWKHAPSLVLQHGFGRSSRFWYSWIPYLSRFYKVVTPELRGLGQSSADFDLEAGLSIDVYLRDLTTVLDHIGADRVHYCGESLGGIIGMAFAAEQPERIRTLSLLSAPVFINQTTQQAFSFGYASWQQAMQAMGIEAWARASNGATRFPADADPGLLEWYAKEMGKSSVEVLVALSRVASQVNVTPYLERIQAPVLGLYPSQAKITDDEQERLLRQGIRDFTVVHLPTPYHAIQNLEPAACARQVLYFASQFDGVPCEE